MGRSISCAVLASLTAIGVAVPAHGDTAPIAPFPPPWSNPAHTTPLELLASRIASHIAGRPVTIHCDADAEWAASVTAEGGSPSGESGFVATQWNGSTGQLLTLSTDAELSPAICGPLQQFAAAPVKPTKCVVRTATLLSASPPAHRASLPVPCYTASGRKAALETPSYWAAYSSYAVAILTLAHESIHLGGTVGGTLSNGLPVGDPEAEAKADCLGMQWMPYVAEQLGDTSDDAQGVARYFWDDVYGLSRTTHPEYWSADCRPGGALDERPPGTGAWP